MGAYLPLPYVYEREGRQERAWDIYSRLLRDRIVFIGTPIDDYVANSIIAQLLFLQMEDPKKDIHVYINSPGGSVSDGMAIYDTLNFMQCDVVTYCIGMAASMSTVLLAAGTPGKRYVSSFDMSEDANVLGAADEIMSSLSSIKIRISELRLFLMLLVLSDPP